MQVLDEDSKEIVATKTIQEGGAFGELALLYNAPRSATIRALTDCQCFVLDTRTFKSVIMANAIKTRNTRYQFIDRVRVFKKMDRYKKLRLLDGLEVQMFGPGNVVVKQDEVGEYFYIIEEG